MDVVITYLCGFGINSPLLNTYCSAGGSQKRISEIVHDGVLLVGGLVIR